jgi:hypothetical protein
MGAKAVDDRAAEALDGLADKTVRSYVDLLRPVTMLIGQVPLRDLTVQDVRRTHDRDHLPPRAPACEHHRRRCNGQDLHPGVSYDHPAFYWPGDQCHTRLS